MTPTEPGWQGLRTVGRFIGIVIVALAAVYGGIAMYGPVLDNPSSMAVPQVGLTTLSSALGVALILLGVLRSMRTCATASASGLNPNLVLPAVIILSGAVLLHGGWGALALSIVVATDAVVGLLGRQRESRAADRLDAPTGGR